MIEQGCGRDGLRQKDNRGWEPIHEACHAKSIQCLRCDKFSIFSCVIVFEFSIYYLNSISLKYTFEF